MKQRQETVVSRSNDFGVGADGARLEKARVVGHHSVVEQAELVVADGLVVIWVAKCGRWRHIEFAALVKAPHVVRLAILHEIRPLLRNARDSSGRSRT